MFIGRSRRRLCVSSFGRSYRGSYYSFDVCDLTSLHKSLSGIWCWSCLGPRVSSWCVVVVLVVVVLSSRCPRRPSCFRCRCRCRRRSSLSSSLAFVVVGAVDVLEFWVKNFTLPPVSSSMVVSSLFAACRLPACCRFVATDDLRIVICISCCRRRSFDHLALRASVVVSIVLFL